MGVAIRQLLSFEFLNSLFNPRVHYIPAQFEQFAERRVHEHISRDGI